MRSGRILAMATVFNPPSLKAEARKDDVCCFRVRAAPAIFPAPEGFRSHKSFFFAGGDLWE
jgi:hypothetical protein